MLENQNVDRRGFLGRLAAVVGGLVAVPALAQPAMARSGRRGWGGGSGRRFYGGGSGRRFYGGGFPGYGGYGGGYGGYGRSYYGGGYGGYGGGYGGYGGYGVPYVQPYRPYYQPYYQPAPYYNPGTTIYLPMNAPVNRPKYMDALSLLEA